MTTLGTFFEWPFSQKKVGDVSYEPETNRFIEFISSNHHRSGSGWSGGSPFLSKKSFVRKAPSVPVNLNPYGKKMYTGSLVAHTPDSASFDDPTFLENFGPSAFRRLNPDKPLMDLGNAIYELKDVPDMVHGVISLRNRFRDLSPSTFAGHAGSVRLADVSNFNLAVAFGWLPLLSDCVSLYQNQHLIKKKLAQLKRDNGRPVRRSIEMKSDSSSSHELVSSGPDQYGNLLYPNFITQVYAGGDFELTRHESKRLWASGEFISWLPDQGQLSDDQWNSEITKRLFGLNPTPSRIYKAMPWSWLIDWFSNVGDNIANLQTNVAERQIANYCFLMRHTETFNRLTVRQRFRVPDGQIDLVSAVTESGTSLKERIMASPFGFGIKIPDLSPFQLTILSSLGGKGMKF